MSRDTLPQSSGGEPGTTAVSAEAQPGGTIRALSQQNTIRQERSGLTGVSYDLLPRLLSDNVEQKGRD